MSQSKSSFGRGRSIKQLVRVAVETTKTLPRSSDLRSGAGRLRVRRHTLVLGLAAATALTTVVTYLNVDPSNPSILLFLVIPIVLISEELGIWAGVTAASVALALAGVVGGERDSTLSGVRAVSWAVVFVTASGVVRHLLWGAKATQPQDLDRAREAQKAQEVAQKDMERLSAREIEILALLAQGASNSQIAESLVISPGTVKSHVHQILNKLGAANRTEAASMHHKATSPR